jgi:hypothetical protein
MPEDMPEHMPEDIERGTKLLVEGPKIKT